MTRILLLACLFVAAAVPRGASGVEFSDFAVFAGNDFQLELFSEVEGDVYAGDDVRLTSSDVNGNVFAADEVAIDLFSDVDGDVFANGPVFLEESSSVSGQVVSGPGSTPSVTAPTVPAFESGSQNVVLIGSNTPFGFDLAPGSYGDVFVDGTSDNIRLSSGDYFVESFYAGDIIQMELSIQNGVPIRIFSQRDLVLDGVSEVTINGIPVDDTMPETTRDFASKVLFASRRDVVFDESILFPFPGTMWATEDVVAGGGLLGGIIAGGDVRARSLVLAEHIPPEPGLLLLAGQPGDYNADGVVDGLDYGVWASTRGSTTDLRADGNGDNVVNAADYGVWREAVSAAAAATPEPGGTSLLALAVVSVRPRKKPRRRAYRAATRPVFSSK